LVEIQIMQPDIPSPPHSRNDFEADKAV